jgi:imidazolonepropionase-like amidohydrolase
MPSNRPVLIFGIYLYFLSSVFSASPFPFPGDPPRGTGLHALLGADLQVKPGYTIKGGILIIRDGKIEKVGKNPAIPEGCREWNCTGKTIYAGFIDPYLLAGSENPKLLELNHDEHIQASADLAFHGLPSPGKENTKKGSGFEVPGVHPERKLVEVLGAGDQDWEKMRKWGFTAAHLAPSEGILRGTGPFVLLSDEETNEIIIRNEVAQIMAFDPVGKNSSPSVYPSSLMGTLSVIRQSILDTNYAIERIQYENKNQPQTTVDLHLGIQALSRSTSGKKNIPIWIEPGSCLMNAKAMEIAREFSLGNPVIIATGDEWRNTKLSLSRNNHYILPLLFPAIPDLPNPEDWEQISLDQLRAWDHAPSMAKLLNEKSRTVSFTTTGMSMKEFHKNILKSINRGLPESSALASLTTHPAKICGAEKLCGTLETGKLANFFIVEGETYFTKNPAIHSTWIQGRPFFHYPADNKKDSNSSKNPKEQTKRLAQFPPDLKKAVDSPPSVLFSGFKLWTCEDQSVLKNKDILIENGKISKIGSNLKAKAPKGCKIVFGKGRHLTPGIIDCHSHAMILGRVNESTLPSTAMVRIADVVNSESVNIERQLAGGVTACNLLHGSSNPIGGQNAVIKLRLGSSPNQLIFKNAPKGIKFALGENVKQSNWGDKYTTRFPQSRMGVRMFFQNRFSAAIVYEKNLSLAQEQGMPFQRNLELETILEIIRGKRLIHCHSYRQDEILVFLRTMEGFGVRVGSLQHVLEGYKVADEIASHGAGASTFSDWWAYKFEVYDAIPYAGAIMHDRGCVVSFNSDSPDHARRLNLEAAKAVKYGGLSEMEAFKFITLNPAKQLGIDRWVGSLRAGKDADIAIWSGNPLDYRTRCEQTWVDGILLHEIDVTSRRDRTRTKERLALLDKARQSLKERTQHENSKKAQSKFFRNSLESACDLHPHSCRSNGNETQCVHQ